MSNYGSKLNKNSFLFSFDNKENSHNQNTTNIMSNKDHTNGENSISFNEFSPSRIMSKPGKHGKAKVNNFLDSDSSDPEEVQGVEQQLAHKLEKQYFLDKSTLLKHLSPDRSKHHSSKTRHNKHSDSNLSAFGGAPAGIHHYNKSSAPQGLGGMLNSSGFGH